MKTFTDQFNLRTLGTIKELPLYHGEYASQQRKKSYKYTPFDDSQFPYVTWKVTVDVDQYVDWREIKDQYGKLSNDWSEYKIEDDRNWGWHSRRDQYAYYHPSDNDNSFEYYHKLGCSKSVAHHLAHCQVMQSLKWLREWQNGDRYYVFVNVEAWIDGVLVAEESLGSCEVDSYDWGNLPYIKEEIENLKILISSQLPKQVQDLVDTANAIYAKVYA